MRTSFTTFQRHYLIHLPILALFNLSGLFVLPTFAQTDSLDSNGDIHLIDYSGSYEDYTIPYNFSSDYILFYLEGGDGGNRNACDDKAAGGKGAEITAAFAVGNGADELQPGGTIRFVVGEQGGNQNTTEGGGAGGGGGTAILYLKPNATIPGGTSIPLLDLEGSADTAWILLAVAGGGGGAFGKRDLDPFENDSCDEDSAKKGTGASAGTSGRGGGGNNDGGTDGYGGESGSGPDGGGGGGYRGNGEGGFFVEGRKGGLTGGAGGFNELCGGCKAGGWGYGGGGGSATAAGGGGGFSGGGGGNDGNGQGNNGGGAGSFVNDAAISGLTLIKGGGNTTNPQNGHILYSFPFLATNDDITKLDYAGVAYDITIPSDLDLDEFNAISFTLRGADGGKVRTVSSLIKVGLGGEGAIATASFRVGNLPQQLQPGGTLRFVVGEAGKSKDTDSAVGGGGGGGTAVLYRPPGVDGNGDCMVSGNGQMQPGPSLNVDDDCWVILAVAGGGGGGRHGGKDTQKENGLNANIEEDGTTKGGDNDGDAGMGGNSGGPGIKEGSSVIVSGGGGGYLPLFPTGTVPQAFQGAPGVFAGGPGGSGFQSALQGGWGYGGGGSGRKNVTGSSHGGGGGGGFSGGGGGTKDPGGGGGSFVNQAAYVSSITVAERTNSSLDGCISYQLFQSPTTGPIASCKSVVPINITGSEEYELLPDEVNQGSYDPSDEDANLDFSLCFVTLGGEIICAPKFSFICENIGTTYDRLLRVSNGTEESYCAFTVEVAQGNVGTFTCPGPQSVALNFNECEAILTDNSPYYGTLVNLIPSDLATCNDSLGYYIIRPDNSIDTFHESDSPTGIVGNFGIRRDTFGIGVSTVVYTSFYSNEEGQQEVQTCSFTVTVNAPVTAITCPDDITVNIPEEDFNFDGCTYFLEHSFENELELDFDQCGDISYRITDSAFDPTITEGQGQLSEFDFLTGINTVEYFVTRPGGEVLSCSFIVDIDTETEIGINLSCPPDQTVSLAEGMSEQDIIDQLTFTATSTCPIAGYELGDFDLVCAEVGAEQNNIDLLVTSATGNVEGCLINITISDDYGVTCPNNFTVDLDAGACTATLTAELLAPATNYLCSSTLDYTVMDAGGMTLLSGSGQVPAQVWASGVYTINYSGENTVGDMSNCSFTVMVNEDQEPPVAICTDVLVGLDTVITDLAALVGATSTDNCGIANYSLSPDIDLSCDNLGVHAVILTVADAAGHQDICHAVVTISDDVAPSITGCPPNNQNVIVNEGTCDAEIPDLTSGLTASDDCSTTFVTQYPTEGTTFTGPHGTTQVVTLEVEDADGNEAATACTVTLTLVDDQAPIAICQDFTVHLDADGQVDLDLATLANASTDNCGITSYQTIIQDCSSGLCFDIAATTLSLDCDDIGSRNINIKVSDAAMNNATCNSTVTIIDILPPIAQCQDVTVNLSSPTATLLASQLNAGSSDNCTFSYAMSSSESGEIGESIVFDCNDIGSLDLQLEVSDESNNSSSCSATVTIVDGVAPVATCMDLTVQLNVAGNASIASANIGTGSDACGVQSQNIDYSDFDCSDVGLNTVILTVTDINGNTSTCSANVTVEDNVAPAALCQNLAIQLDNSGNKSITAAEVNNNSGDACGIQSLSLNEMDFDCSQVGTNTVILTAIDQNNNSSTCSATITVEDNIAPMAICKNTTVKLDANGNGLTTTDEIDNGSNDACGIQVVSLNQASFDCSQVGANTIILTATDQNNNTNTCSATVYVQDLAAPNALCTNTTVQLDAAGNGAITTADVDNGSADACGMQSISLDKSDFNCSEIGNQTVLLTATDINGNTANCTATVTVEDNIAPEIECQSGFTVNTDPGSCEMALDLAVPTNSDNCAVTVLRHRRRFVDHLGNDIPGIEWSGWALSSNTSLVLSVGHWKIQWQAEDASGNQKACDFIIVVIDNEPPNAVCLNPSIEFNGEQQLFLTADQVWDELASSDNCTLPTLVDISPGFITCDQIGMVVPVTVMIEDAGGNPASCTANVTVGGLPCNWSGNPDGINCQDGNEAGYDPNTNTFNITSEGCYDPNFYSNSDSHGFISTQLCGDGEITAQVTQVSNSGFAGVSMREDLSPGSPMLQLGIDGGIQTKRELRLSANGIAFNHLFQTQGRNWLRLTRSGNTFGAYHSTDGSNWQPVLITNIPMSDCIEVGLYSENNTPMGSISATFENVSVTTLQPLTTPATVGFTAEVQLMPELTIYPNPTSGLVNLQFEGLNGKPAQVKIYNQTGQLMYQFRQEDFFDAIHKIDANDWASGLYLVEVIANDQRMVKKLILNR